MWCKEKNRQHLGSEKEQMGKVKKIGYLGYKEKNEV